MNRRQLLLVEQARQSVPDMAVVDLKLEGNLQTEAAPEKFSPMSVGRVKWEQMLKFSG